MIYTVNKLSYGRDGASRATDRPISGDRASGRAGRRSGRGEDRDRVGQGRGGGEDWKSERRTLYIILLQRWRGMCASGPRPVGTRTFYYFIVPVLYNIIFCTFYFYFTATTVQRVYVSSSTAE